MNLASIIEVVADHVGDVPAVVHGDRVRSWPELEDRAARLAAHLAAHGVGLGTRVAIGLFNSCEYVETVLAILKVRATPVNINYRYKESELRHVLVDSGASAVVFDAVLAERVAAVTGDLGGFTALVQLGGDAPIDGAVAFPQVMRTNEPMPRIERQNDEWLLYTGGTTGLPKGVLASHTWVFRICVQSSFRLLDEPTPESLDDLAALTAARAPTDRLVCMPLAPLMHGVGIYNTIATLQAGGTVVFADARSFDPALTIDLAVAHDVTDIALVGDAFARPLADELDARAERGEPADLGALRRVRSTGATWSAPVKRRMMRHGRFVCADMIAASEGGPFAVSRVGPDPADVPDTARFRLAPEARLLDRHGRDVVAGSGDVGRLAAPTDAGIHYIGDAAKTEATFPVVDGRRYVVPGDMATLDADGTLVFKGRGSGVINSGGEKVHAGEVEDVLLDHPDVREAVVIGLPDERWGQRVVAVLAVRDGAELTTEDVRSWVGDHLADYKRPREVIIVDRLERSPAGKTDLRWARAVAEASPALPLETS